MSDALTITRFTPDEWRTYRHLRLRALAESPEAFGSTLAMEAARPDEEWARRLEVAAAHTGTELPLVARVGGEAVGLAWGRILDGAPEVAHVFQVWVAPEHRGIGAGGRLLESVVAWARGAGARYLDLEVTQGETPAVRLYTRMGSRPSGAPRPLREGSPHRVQPLRLALADAAPPPG